LRGGRRQTLGERASDRKRHPHLHDLAAGAVCRATARPTSRSPHKPPHNFFVVIGTKL